MTSERTRLVGVQVLRLFAAALVAVQHGVFYTATSYGADASAFYKWGFGTTGVFIFFVISGYVIARQVGISPGRFALHRVARIYPAHLAAIAIGGALLLAVGYTTLSSVQFDGSLLLFPVGTVQNWPRVPYWTLIFEMFFYTVTFVLMLGGRAAFDMGLIAWAGALLTVSLFKAPITNPAPDIFNIGLSPWALLFIAGAALARAHAGSQVPLTIIAAGGLTTAYLTANGQLDQIVLCSGATLAAIHLLVLAEHHTARFSAMRHLAKAGDWSYGLYLLHAPIMAAVALGIGAAVLPFPAALVLVTFSAVAGGLLYGWAEHGTYERVIRPALDRLPTLRFSMRRPATQSAAA